MWFKITCDRSYEPVYTSSEGRLVTTRINGFNMECDDDIKYDISWNGKEFDVIVESMTWHVYIELLIVILMIWFEIKSIVKWVCASYR